MQSIRYFGGSFLGLLLNGHNQPEESIFGSLEHGCPSSRLNDVHEALNQADRFGWQNQNDSGKASIQKKRMNGSLLTFLAMYCAVVRQSVFRRTAPKKTHSLLILFFRAEFSYPCVLPRGN